MSNYRILESFIDEWVDNTCRDHSNYEIRECGPPANDGVARFIRIDFTNPEDAVSLRLQGVPPGYIKYIDFV